MVGEACFFRRLAFFLGVFRGRFVVVDVLYVGGRMRACLLTGFLILFSAFSSVAFSADTYYSHTINGGTVRHPSASGACEQIRVVWYPYKQSSDVSFSGGYCHITGVGDFYLNYGSCASGQALVGGQSGPNGSTTYGCVVNNCPGGQIDTVTGACIDLTSVCNSKNGMTENSIQFPITNGVSIAPSCLGGCAVASNGSAIILDGATSTVTSAKYTGQTCSAAGITSTATPPASGQSCGQVNGKTLCLTASNPNCGTINGQNICLETAPSGSCTYLPGGSYICDSKAPNDATHRPIDGNGNPIKPSATLASGPASTTDRDASYWDSSTMSNASNGTAADGKGNKVGDCVGATCGAGDGGDDEQDTGTDAQLPEWGQGDSCDLDCSLSELWGELNSVPLIQAFSNIGASLPTGSQCPKPVFEVFGTQIQMTTHCDLYDQVAPILSACFRFMWAFLAVVVLLKA